MLQPTCYSAHLFGLSYGSPLAQAILEPHLRREAHRFCHRGELRVAGVIYPALAEVGHVRPAHNTTCGLIDLLAAPLAPVRMTVHLQEDLKLLRDVHSIYDARGHAV